jgi:hypothetical protein
MRICWLMSLLRWARTHCTRIRGSSMTWYGKTTSISRHCFEWAFTLRFPASGHSNDEIQQVIENIWRAILQPKGFVSCAVCAWLDHVLAEDGFESRPTRQDKILRSRRLLNVGNAECCLQEEANVLRREPRICASNGLDIQRRDLGRRDQDLCRKPPHVVRTIDPLHR